MACRRVSIFLFTCLVLQKVSLQNSSTDGTQPKWATRCASQHGNRSNRLSSSCVCVSWAHQVSACAPAGKRTISDWDASKPPSFMCHHQPLQTRHTHFTFVAKSKRPNCPYCKSFQDSSSHKNLTASHRRTSKKNSRDALLQFQESSQNSNKNSPEMCPPLGPNLRIRRSSRGSHTRNQVKHCTGGLRSNTRANKCISGYAQAASASGPVECKHPDRHRQSANMSSFFSPRVLMSSATELPQQHNECTKGYEWKRRGA